MKQYKIIAHLSKENEYRSFLRSMYDVNSLDISGTSVHRNLFEIYYQHKPNIIIFSADEYTQEIHDFIHEYHKKCKIILFVNVKIDNPEMLNFWNSAGVVCVGQKNMFPASFESKFIYEKLYDSKIYSKLENVSKVDKIAVMLSRDDALNDALVGDHLYPKTKEKLVLFNSATYDRPQNVGSVGPADICVILNTYKYLIDIDNNYGIEAKVCGIDNVSTEDNILENIKNKNFKQIDLDIKLSSYEYFINNQFLPNLIKE